MFSEMHIFKECGFIGFNKSMCLCIPRLYQDIEHFITPESFPAL